MNVLIACEESQRVCLSFRKQGLNAFSCDVQECSGGHPEFHILGDVLPLLKGDCSFTTMNGDIHNIFGKWDLIVAFPPCTDLAASGARWFKQKRDDGRQKRSIDFFMQFVNCQCERIAIENPIGIMSSIYKKPSQIIQPYQFGHNARKSTCLWLKGLPLLKPTKIVDPGVIVGKGFSVGANLDCARIDDKILAWKNPLTAKIRSKTFQGIADAMGDQWGNFIMRANCQQ